MTYNELRRIIQSSQKDDWLFDDQRGVHTYKEDLNLRLQRNEIDFDMDKFSGEDWATRHPDPVAYRVTYDVYYGASFVEEHLLVAVDGFRATLPLPKVNTNEVSQANYHFASLVDQHDSLDDYMRRASLKVTNV